MIGPDQAASMNRGIITQKVYAYRDAQVLSAFLNLGISSYLNQPETIAGLAVKVKLNKDALRQVAFAWTEQGLIEQTANGQFYLTSQVAAIEDDSLLKTKAASFKRSAVATMSFARHRIPDYLANNNLSVSELERSTGLSAEVLKIVGSMWREESLVATDLRGRLKLTALGEVLRSDIPGSMAGRVSLWDYQARYWRELSEIIRTGTPGPILVDGQGFYPTTQQNPELNAMFGRAMTEMSEDRAQAILDVYNFEGVKCLVDVGGGNGKLLGEYLKANSSIQKGILFDLPEVINNPVTEEVLKSAGVLDCCKLEGGSYFDRLPEGGDLYFLSKILHNNPDDKAREILQRCKDAMVPGGRILIADWVRVDKVTATSDGRLSGPESNNMHMLVMTGGKERTERELRELLDSADFRLTKIIPTTADVSLIEAVIA